MNTIDTLVANSVNSNNRRSREGNAALQAYIVEALDTDLHFYPDEITDDIALIYLLAALRHLCMAQGWSFAELDKKADRAFFEDIDGNPTADATFAE